MKVIVHIGDGKCGSTAIQAALHAQRHRLRREGIVYETGVARKDHFLIGTLLGNPTRSRNSVQSQSDYARANLREVARLSRDADLVILSAESLFVNATPPRAILDLLRAELRPEDPINVVVYVRPPCDMYSSLLQQEIKGTHLFTPPHLYARPIDNRIVAWQEALAAEAPEIRVFDPARLDGGDVVKDFEAAVARLTGRNLGLEPARRNHSLSAEQTAILLQLRRRLPRETAGVFHPKSDRLIALFETINNTEGLLGTPIRLSPGAKRAIARHNAPIVDRVNGAVPGLELWLGGPDDTAQAARELRPGVLEDVFAGMDAALQERLDQALLSPSDSKAARVRLAALLDRPVQPEGPVAAALHSFMACPEDLDR